MLIEFFHAYGTFQFLWIFSWIFFMEYFHAFQTLPSLHKLSVHIELFDDQGTMINEYESFLCLCNLFISTELYHDYEIFQLLKAFQVCETFLVHMKLFHA